jgi:hypothetical protein
MIPIDAPPEEPQDFPLLGPAVIVLAAYAILAVTLPANLVRSIVALAAFFSMGYAMLALIVDGHVRLSAAEVLAFTVGLTVLFTSLSALAVSIIGIPITEFAIVIVGLPVGVLAWLLRRPRTRAFTAVLRFSRTFFDFSDYSRGEKGIAAILLVAIVIALGAFISLAFVHYPDTPTTGLTITWTDFANPNSFNGTFVLGQPQNITVTALGNATGGSFTLRIRLVPVNWIGNGTCGAPGPGQTRFNCTTQTSPLRMGPFTQYNDTITVAAGGMAPRTFSIIMDARGRYELRFELLDASSAVVAKNEIPVRVP